MSDKLRILVTGFGPFPGAPYNPTQPLVARLLRLRRPAFCDVELTGHIFPVTYKAVDRELPELLAKRRPDALLMFGLASRTPYLRIESRARNAVTMLWPDADHTRVRKGSISGSADAMTFGPHTAKLLRAADRHRHRCAGLARCRQLSLQLSELARDRGDLRRRRPSPRRFRACAAAAARRHVAAQRRDASRHAGRTGRCRRGDAAGDGEAGAKGGRNFVGWAKALLRRAHQFFVECFGGHAEPVIGRAFARPGRFAHPTIVSLLAND